ncbi:MAG: cyclic nucleotide-binding domain-containing protein [Defluviitaleaceae bacterium]|nr:cyclic nucleotide-binding domain-containing protein [Defluviitaleaceae bacterium]
MLNITELSKASPIKTLQEGYIVIKEKEREPYNMYVLLKGEVGVYKDHGTKEEILLDILKPGAFFGEMSLFLHEARTATVIVLRESQLLEISQQNAYEMIEQHPVVSYDLIKALCERVKNLNDELKRERADMYKGFLNENEQARYLQEGEEWGIIKGRQEGELFGVIKGKVELLYRDFSMPPEQIAKRLLITKDRVTKIIDNLNF